MPAFGAYAERLSAGLAAQHGFAATAPVESAPVDDSAATMGRQMVVSAGCANCHNVGEFVGGQSPSTAGINFAYTAERLLYPYFHRWMLNPPRVWPETVMPRYFSGSKGPFPFYDGNTDQQIRRSGSTCVWGRTCRRRSERRSIRRSTGMTRVGQAAFNALATIAVLAFSLVGTAQTPAAPTGQPPPSGNSRRPDRRLAGGLASPARWVARPAPGQGARGGGRVAPRAVG